MMTAALAYALLDDEARTLANRGHAARHTARDQLPAGVRTRTRGPRLRRRSAEEICS